jgi:hypothetical protein
MRILRSLALVAITATVASADVVITMPPPKGPGTATPGGRDETGQIALNRYAHARVAPRDTYMRGVGLFTGYSVWGPVFRSPYGVSFPYGFGWSGWCGWSSGWGGWNGRFGWPRWHGGVTRVRVRR